MKQPKGLDAEESGDVEGPEGPATCILGGGGAGVKKFGANLGVWRGLMQDMHQ